MKETDKRINSLESRLEQFFNLCESKRISKWKFHKLCWPLYWKLIQQEYGRTAKILATLIAIWILIFVVPFLSWTFSAIGRILLIKLLPYYQWTDLYNKKCLISSSVEEGGRRSPGFVNSLDCSVCENLSEFS